MKLRKLLAAALSLTIFFGAAPTITDYNQPNSYFTASATDIVDSGECGESATWQLDSEGTLTISGEGDVSSRPWITEHKNDIITIIVKDGITTICTNAFTSTSVQAAEIADSVTVMRDGTFNNCQNLTSVKLSNSLKKINTETFYHCSSLTTLEIPNSVEEIASVTFCYSGIKEIVIPESVTRIGICAFEDITDFKSITILNPDCNIRSCIKDGTVIGYTSSTAQKFAEENGLIFKSLDEISVVTTSSSTTSANNTVTNINTTQTSVNAENVIASGECGESTTWSLDKEGTLTIMGKGEISTRPWLTEHKNNIKTIIIKDGITHIRTYAFTGTSVQKAEIADSVIVMRAGTFNNCQNLSSVKLSNSLKKINTETFYHCSSLTTLEIPNSVEEIASVTFCYSGIKEIVIPKSVTRIGICAFEDIADFKSITILNPDCNIKSCIKDGTVIGYLSSTAQKYAEENGFTFKSLGEAPTSTETTTVTTMPAATTTTAPTNTIPSSVATTTTTTNASTEKPATTTTTYKTETSDPVVTTTAASVQIYNVTAVNKKVEGGGNTTYTCAFALGYNGDRDYIKDIEYDATFAGDIKVLKKEFRITGNSSHTIFFDVELDIPESAEGHYEYAFAINKATDINGNDITSSLPWTTRKGELEVAKKGSLITHHTLPKTTTTSGTITTSTVTTAVSYTDTQTTTTYPVKFQACTELCMLYKINPGTQTTCTGEWAIQYNLVDGQDVIDDIDFDVEIAEGVTILDKRLNVNQYSSYAIIGFDFDLDIPENANGTYEYRITINKANDKNGNDITSLLPLKSFRGSVEVAKKSSVTTTTIALYTLPSSTTTTTTTVASTTEESATTNSTTTPLTVVGKWKHDKTYDGAGNLVQIPDDICMNIELREDYTALISAFSSSAGEKYDAVWRTEGDIIIISITEPNEDIMKLTFDSENQILSTCEFDDGSGRKAYFVRSDTSTLGDVNSDGKVDAKDASLILLEYAQASTGAEDVIAEEQKKDADVNRDGKVDAKDASAVLQYYAYTSTGGKDPIDQYLG